MFPEGNYAGEGVFSLVEGEWGWKRGLLSVFAVGEGKNVLFYT